MLTYVYRYQKQMSRGTEVEIMKAELEERGFTLKVRRFPAHIPECIADALLAV